MDAKEKHRACGEGIVMFGLGAVRKEGKTNG